MSDVPNRPEPPAPLPIGDSARQIYEIPDNTKCLACDLPVMQGQTAVETDVGNILHSYCWDQTR